MTSYPDNNPKTAFGIKKPSNSFTPLGALRALGQVMEFGAKKYGRFNWRGTKVASSVYYNAATRHLNAWFEGEDIDPESGFPHLAHVMACAAIILDADEHKMQIDDRLTIGKPLPPKELKKLLNSN